MKLIAPALAAAMLTFAATPAFAYSWLYLDEEKLLMGSTGEEEGDTDFRATCKGNGKAEIGIGAQPGIGKGEGEAVSATLIGGGKMLSIAGKSGKSPNFEMTGGVELQTEVDSKHEIFALLLGKGPIKVTAPIKVTWAADGRAAATKEFQKACFGG